MPTKRPVSLIDQMIERNKPREDKPAPICPVCSTEEQPVKLLRTTHGVGGYRCPVCLLAFGCPVPLADELPALKRCPECLKRNRLQMLVRLDWGWLWCRTCNFSEHVLTAKQQAALEWADRRVVNGCYGDSCKGIKGPGGSKSSGRKRGDGKRGFAIVRPLDIERVSEKKSRIARESTGNKRS
jgi:hypothetical protein